MSDSVSWRIRQNGEDLPMTGSPEETLLEALRRREGPSPDAPCGGKGTCGKCRVRIIRPESPDREETVLACETRPEEGMTVLLSPGGKDVSGSQGDRHRAASGTVPVSGPLRTADFSPLPGSLKDQRDDISRFRTLPGAENARVPLSLMEGLHSRLNGTAPFRAVFRGEDLLEWITPEEPVPLGCFAAADIGTTTVVVYLVDAAGGKILDIRSEMNSQRSFGADVISRMEHAQKDSGSRREIRERLTRQLHRMVLESASAAGIPPEKIRKLVVAANTVMVHLLLELPTDTICRAPFVPVLLAPDRMPAARAGIPLPGCDLEILPGLSAYVGADITAGLAAVELHKSEELCLFLDAGTNGEMALGSREGILACSTAAGPAFEGAQLSCGTGGVPGAVSRVRKGPRGLILETIENRTPAGICGSGIIDALAVCLDLGAVDETGRIDTGFSRPGFSGLVEPAPPEEGGWRLVLHREGEHQVYLSQKDLREIQLAKAAIAAGIRTLIGRSGADPGRIGRIYLAGGFGYYINEASALRVGLIPSFLAGKVVPSGNTSGWGAVLAGASVEAMETLRSLPSRIRTLELSGDPEFQNHYIEEMLFPAV